MSEKDPQSIDRFAEMNSEQRLVVERALSLVMSSKPIYRHTNFTQDYKEVPTTGKERLQRFVVGMNRIHRPAEYMKYLGTKNVYNRAYRQLIIDDEGVLNTISAEYSTDSEGISTDELTGLTFERKNAFTIDLLDPAYFDYESLNDENQARIREVIAFIDRKTPKD